jgi:L-lactate dehydrogenase complex protein LldE
VNGGPGGDRRSPDPGRVALMVTCLVDLVYPDVGFAAARLLESRGVAVEVPPGQTCCGLPLFNSGYRAEAARVARRTLGLFRDAPTVAVPSGSCAWMVRAEYPHLFPDDPATAALARRVADRTFELSQLLVALDGPGAPPAGGPIPAPAGAPAAPPAASPAPPSARARVRVAYHDSCHLLRGLGEARAPRRLLAGMAGIEVVELPGADECCGFGGSFAVRLPDVSGAILRRKLENVRASGADVVVACDAGCLAQIAGGLERAGDRVRALHLAELLAGGVAGVDGGRGGGG